MGAYFSASSNVWTSFESNIDFSQFQAILDHNI